MNKDYQDRSGRWQQYRISHSTRCCCAGLLIIVKRVHYTAAIAFYRGIGSDVRRRIDCSRHRTTASVVAKTNAISSEPAQNTDDDGGGGGGTVDAVASASWRRRQRAVYDLDSRDDESGRKHGSGKCDRRLRWVRKGRTLTDRHSCPTSVSQFLKVWSVCVWFLRCRLRPDFAWLRDGHTCGSWSAYTDDVEQQKRTITEYTSNGSWITECPYTVG